MYRHLHKPALRVIRTCACATLPKTTISSASRLTPLLHSRHLATPPPQVVASNLTPSRYNELSDSTMDNMLNALEELLDSEGNPAYEVEYHSGVLTLNLGSHGTYVINKQPPNQQIWLSSPSR
ncbi:hypothetical protein DL96DRAFT_1702371 [Flagelloscypha sp. PMI_526]|nr:hypothetical protein DL96DRAFT_1702371 [Flagelloscypha sp. PMI_526]